MAGAVVGQHLRQPDHRSLGSAIGAAPPAAAQPRHRADVDDGPPARVAHDARGGAGDHEGADDVDVEHLANEGGWRFEGSTVGGDAGRIDHAVDAAERLARHGDRLFRGGLVGDIERLGEQAPRLGYALRKLCQRLPSRSMAATFQPAWSSRATVAHPMPDPAPVTSATLSPPSLALATRLTHHLLCAPASGAGPSFSFHLARRQEDAPHQSRHTLAPRKLQPVCVPNAIANSRASLRGQPLPPPRRSMSGMPSAPLP